MPKRNTFKEKRFILALESPGSVAPGSGVLKQNSIVEGMVGKRLGREGEGGGREGEGKRERECVYESESRVLPSKAPSHGPQAIPHLLKLQLGPKPSIPEHFEEITSYLNQDTKEMYQL